MSTTIDNKVVEMQFDNKHFEKNVQTSLKTLDTLKKSLDLTGASKGLENVNVAAKKCNLSPLSNAAENVKVKFSAMEVMAVTALANITNSAVNAGKRIASSLTIEPIRTGFNEYELKMNSIQTIMSATGATLETVNGYLNELNTYSDKTIYSFSDMTQNIAKFVNAGVSLDDSVLAIQGISNEAALAGANANEASRAMYNFSQALSTGYVQRIDWKSIELANMATVSFKEELLESAIAMGTVKKNADGMYATLANPDKFYNTSQMFIETLDDQWLTTEVLIDTLKEYSDETTELGKKAFAAAQDVKTFSMMMDTLKESAQSGWAATWELLVGDLEEAKELWTSITKVVGGLIEKTSNIRNNFLGEALNSNWEKFVGKLGEAGVGVKDFEEQLTKTLEAAGIDTHKILKEHETWENAIRSNAVEYKYLKKALDDVNGKLIDLSKIRREIKMGSKGDDVKIAQEALKKLGYDLGEFGEKMDGIDGIVGDVTENAIKAFQKAEGLKVTGIIDDETLEALEKANSLTKKLDKSFGNLLKDFDKKGGRELMIEALANAFERLKDVLKVIGEAWSNVFSPLSASKLYDLISAFHKFTENLQLNKTTADNIRSTFEGLFSVLKFLKDVIVGVLSVGLDLIKALFAPLANITLSTTGTIGKLIKKVLELASDGFEPLSKSLEVVIEFVETLAKFLSDVFVTVVKEVTDAVGEWVKKFKETETFKTISEAFSTASETISGALDTIKEKIESFDFGVVGGKLGAAVSWLIDLGKTIKNSEFVGSVIDKVSGAFNSFINFIKGIKINVDSLSIVKFFDFLTKNNYTGLKGGIVGAFTYLKDNVLGYNFKNFINNSFIKFSEFWNKQGDFVRGAFEKCKQVVASIAEFIFGAEIITLPDILALAERFLKILILLKILGIVNNVSSAISSIGETFENISKTAKWQAVAASFKAMAIALAAFAACMWVISKIGTAEALKAAGIMVGIVAAMGGVIAALLFLSSKLDTGIQLTTAIFSLIGIAAALLVMIKALKEVDQLALENPGRSVLIMLGMIAAIAGALLIVGKALNGSTLGSAAAILTMLTALKMIPSILSEYAEFDWNGVRQVIPIMFGMLAGLALVLRLASGSLKGGAKAGGLALVLIAMVLSLKVLMEVIQELGEMDQVKMAQGIKGILAILAGMTVMMVALNLSGKMFKVDKGQRIVTSFAGLATSLLAVAATIWILGNMPLDVLKQGGLAVAAILGVFTIMMSSIGKATSGSFKLGGLTVMLLGMGVLIAEMGVIVSHLAKYGWADAIGAAGAISVLLLSLAGSCFILTKSQGQIMKAVGTAYLMSGLVIILAGIVGYMSHLGVGASVETAAALSMLLMSLSAACLILSKAVFINAGTIGIAYAMSGVLAIIAVVLGLLTACNVGPTLEIATSLSIILVALSAACLILSRIGPMGTVAAAGASALLQVLGIVAAVLLAAGSLIALIPGSDTFLDKVTVILEKLGRALGSFVGGIVGGFVDAAFLASLPDLARRLSEFMTELQPFLDGVKSLDENAVNSISTLAKALLVLTAAEFVDGLAAAFGGGQNNLAAFGTNVAAFGASLVQFSKSVSELSDDDVAKISIAAEAGLALAEVGKAITRTGGWIQDFAGEKNLATFGSTLSGFGNGLVAYYESISGLPKDASEKIIDSAGAAKAVADVAAAVPRTGGVWQDFIGEKDLLTFGGSLAAFGGCILSYYEVIKTLPKGAIETITESAGAADALADVATSVPRTDGMWQDIAGEQDIATFGASLKAFGKGLMDYVKAVAELPEDAAEKITSSSTAMEALIGISDMISRTGGWGEAIVGTKDVEAFGSGMSALAKGIVDYIRTAESITEESIEAIKRSKTAMEQLNQVSKLAPTTLAGFGTDSVNMAIGSLSKLLDLMGAMSGVDYGGVSSFSSALSSLASVSIDGFVEAFSNANTRVVSSVSSLLKAILNTIGAKYTDFVTAGKDAMSKFASGITKQKKSAADSAETVVKKALSAIKAKYDSFVSAGEYLGEGLVAGIEAMEDAAYWAGYALGQAAAQGEKDGQQSNSPSKLTIQAGKWLGQGLVIGIQKMGRSVYNAGYGMGDAAVNSLSSAIARISDVVNSDIDAQPTIRPVLDLSDIRSGAGIINSMFSMQPSVGVLSNVNAINSMMNRRQNGVTNTDVVAAIKDLGNKINQRSGDTYSINGITYDDGSNISDAVRTLVRAARVERRT